MNENLSQEEVGILIHGKKILRAKGLPMDADVKAIWSIVSGRKMIVSRRNMRNFKSATMMFGLRMRAERLRGESTV